MSVLKDTVTENMGAYYVLLASTLFLFLAALGPGLYNADAPAHYTLFKNLCHQEPVRTFMFRDQLMAGCSRCLGVYSGAFTGALLLPLAGLLPVIKKNLELYLFGFATLLNFADLGGNYFGIWTNTLVSRLILGLIFGFAAVLLLNRQFFKTKHTEM